MKTLIIPCAGNGNRMSQYFFTKPLLPLKQRPILFQIIDYWKPFIDQVVLVLNGKNKNLIKEYIDKYYPDKNLKIDYCIQNRISGTYFAIKKAIDVAKNKELILNWSDVCLDINSDDVSFMDKQDNNLVFTTDKIACRWKVIDGKFFHDKEKKYTTNGIVGVFLIKNKDEMFYRYFENEREEELEILEALDESKFEDFKYEHFYDIGDSEKYSLDLRKVDKNSETRAFGSGNKMEIKENVVIKYTSDKKLKENEENWYKNANFSFIPQVRSYDPLTLERLDAIPVHDKLISYPTEDIEYLIISKLFLMVKEIHLSKGTEEGDFESSYNQYYAKTIKRLENVDFMFKSFNKDIIKINGRLYRNPLIVLKENEEKIKGIFSKNFRFIHGDIQLCNTLIDKNNKLFMIDPRGYFGSKKLFGDPMYDFAKMYYGICGMYGSFCIGENEFKVNEDGSFKIKPLLDESTYQRRREKFIKEFEKIDYKEHGMKAVDLLHAIIWLSVTDYTANDVLSCMYAYLKGTVMINEVFEEY